MRRTLWFILAASGAIAGASNAPAATSCAGLAQLKLSGAEVVSAVEVGKGGFVPPPSPQPPGQRGPNPIFATLPAFCAVTLAARPSRDSDIRIAIWLPLTGWNGRLQGVGNGAFSSNIAYQGLAQALAEGYAAAANNTGKEGDDAAVTIGHPQKIVDWGHRAVHEMAVRAKQVIAAFYGKAVTYAYFNSCSTGGRQAMVAAQYHPADFDGIVVGDPANPMTRQQANSLWNHLAVTKTAESFIPPAKWEMVHRRVVTQCDARDGVTDGLIADPRRCGFDMESLRCTAGDGPDCLTGPQMVALRATVEGAVNPRTGEQVYVGYPLGTVMYPGSTAGPKPDSSATSTFRMLLQDPTWDYRSIDFDRDVARADAIGNQTINAVDYAKYRSFFARGGKMLMYHGWNDSAISPLISIRHYEQLVAALGGRTRAEADVRLFMVPGMGHCAGGEGPSSFDKMGPLSAWVEQGRAPDSIVAAHMTNGVADRTRPLCPFPQMARYSGSGNIDDARNFSCAPG